jgi:two-component system chemotaxis response regulator CheY
MPSAIIIDDSPIMRAQLRKLLVAAGFTVVAEAGVGDVALALYEQHRPDLITLDIVMPGRDGATAAVELLAAYPDATIVMCTSLSTRERIDMCRNAGVKFYLLKPFDPDYATAVFRHAVASSPRAAKPDDKPTGPPANATTDEMVR